VVRKLSVPHRIVSVLEGEGLLNDATALTAFKFAAAAVVSGSFHLEYAVLGFLAMVVGEVGYGLLLGWVISQVRRRLKDPSLEITVSFLTPFLAYLLPERLGGSGVLATAVTGLYIGSQSAKIFTLGVRLFGLPIWQLLVFIFNNFLFLVTGLQLRSVLGQVSDYSPATLLYYGAFISGVVILSRMIWVYPGAFLPRALSAGLRARDPMPPFRRYCGTFTATV
jgi:NhaP-type Na+/H+ or K+/H+ antiporter